MPFHVKANLGGLNRKLSDSAARHARLAVASDAQQAMEKYVPKDEGNLRKAAVVASDGKSIEYTMPYAAAQFYGVVNGGKVTHYSTPGTSKRWDLRLKGNKQDMSILENELLKGLLHYGNNS